MASSRGPRLLGHRAKILSEADTARVRKVIARYGITNAPSRLGFSKCVIFQARDFGRISEETATRLMAVVEREEATANVA